MKKRIDNANNKGLWNSIKFGGTVCLLSTTLIACGKDSTSTNAYVAPKTETICEHIYEMTIQNDEETVINHIISEHLSKEGAYDIKYSYFKDDKRISIVEPTKLTRILDGVEKIEMYAPQGYILYRR